MVSRPTITPVSGNGTIVITFPVEATPQLSTAVYTTVSRPPMAPTTTPVGETMARVFTADHVPGPTMSESTICLPTHSDDGPVITPGFGTELTVTCIVAYTAPHVVVRM